MFIKLKFLLKQLFWNLCPCCHRYPDEPGYLRRIVNMPNGPATERYYIACPVCQDDRFFVNDVSSQYGKIPIQSEIKAQRAEYYAAMEGDRAVTTGTSSYVRSSAREN